MPQMLPTPYGELVYEIVDNSAPTDFVVLNGNLATRHWWKPSFQFLKQGWDQKNLKGRTLHIELPGCGGSSEIPQAVTIQGLTNVYADFFSAQGLSPDAVLMGHSTGGLLAGYLAAHPKMNFAKTLLLNPVGPSGFTADEGLLARYRKMQRDPEFAAFAMGSTIYKCDYNSDFFKNQIAPDTFESVKKLGSLMAQAMNGLDSTATFKKMKGHVTVIFGEHDHLLSRDDAKKITELAPSAEFVLLPDVGHCLNIEKPELMARVLQKYLF